MSDSDLTLEEVDLAIAAAQMRGDSQDDLALLWYVRADILDVAVKSEYLCYVMGVDPQEAAAITERLLACGYMEAS